MRVFFRPARRMRLRVLRPLSLILNDTRLRLRVAYGVVLFLGLLFSGLIFLYSEDVLHDTQRLVRRELPVLKQIASLKAEIGREEAALYDFYATGDQERFARDFAASQRRAQQLIVELERHTRAELLQAVRVDHETLQLLARDIERSLDPTSPMLGDSHPMLMRASLEVRDIYAELEALAGVTEARVRDSANQTGDTVRRMAHLGAIFSLGIFLVAVFIGHYINVYVRESAERRRLAVFAERNPNPVLRLSFDGHVIYANAAAQALARAMGAESAQVLLPENASERLGRLRGRRERYEVWDYERQQRSFECGIHFLPDLSSFHAYVTDVTERRLSEERLVHQAYHNAVTNLPNRRMLQEVAEQTLRAPDHGGTRAALYLLGLDRFKLVIDTLGHDVGDKLLQTLGERLRQVLDQCRDLAPNATLYHVDAEVYAVFAPGVPSSQAAVLLAEKLTEGLAQPMYVTEREFFVSASIGVAAYPDDGDDIMTLLRNADSAMHLMREQGGGGFRLYKPEMNAVAAQWLSLENFLRHSIERNELRLYYQPQVDVRTGRVVALEALLRWDHPTHGILSPKEWVGLAEESGLIIPISEWALRAACEQNREWRRRGVMQTVIAVNVSGRQFHQQDLPRLVAQVLADTGLEPNALELEVTESVAMLDIERTVIMLRELKRMGVRLAIDDFGTGFSSLAYLKRFPLDKLKIDQSFVHHLTSDDTDSAITRAIVTLGHALKLKVGAEGVQTREQLARLRLFQCDLAQGTLYSEAAPAHEIERLLRAHPRLAGA
jgi:diguanylate cyclase (GGDEF)-like protein